MKLLFELIIIAVTTLCFGGEALEVSLKKCDRPPKIDGILDDACWKTAVKINKFNIIGKNETVNKHKAYITCDDSWLYVAYDVLQPETERVEPKYTRWHDDYVQRDDCVKISFDPGTNGKMWYHFKVNRANCRGDRRFVNGKQEVESWNIPWRSSIKNETANWTAELAIPLCLLYPFDNWENARINLLISCNEAKRDPQGVIVGTPEKVRYSWAPLINWFVEPGRFNKIKGMNELEISAPFLPRIEYAKVTEYFRKDGKFYYGIDLSLKTYTATPGKLQLSVEDITSNGEHSKIIKNLDVPRNYGEKIIKFRIPVKSLVKREAILRMTNASTGEEFQNFHFKDQQMAALNLFSGYLDRSYYTSETNATAVCSVGLPEAGLGGMYFQAFDNSGKLLAADKNVRPESLFKIPLDTLAEGTHQIVVRLYDRKAREVSSLNLRLTKRKPEPGCEWKIDYVNRVLLNNGKPFFAMGFCMHHLEEDDISTLKKISGSGFNFIMLWNRLAKPEKIAAYCDLFERAGLYMMPAVDDMVCSYKPQQLDSMKKYLKGKDYQTAEKYCNGFTNLKCKMSILPALARLPKKAKNDIFAEFVNKKLPDTIRCVDAAKRRKRIIGWWIFDEPLPDIFDQWLMGGKVYDRINQTDGYHPVAVNYSSHIPEMKEATSWFDILITDPYWIQAGEVRNTPNFVSQIVSNTNLRAAERRQPAWSLLLGAMWSGTRKRLISPAEQACQTYLAAIHGATGIFYFTYGNINDKASWNAVTDMARQFKILGPACVAPKVKQKISYRTANKAGKIINVVCDPAKGKFTSIQASLKRNPDGGYILMAANSRYYPLSTRITVKNLKKGVKTIFTNRNLQIKNGAFEDNFEPFGVRAYSLPETLSEPVEIEILATPPAEIPTPERSVNFACRKDHKNKFCNPSFETATVKSWPDYFLTTFFGKRTGPYIGEPGAVWGQDDEFAKFGKYSLKLSTPAFGDRGYGRVYWYCAPQTKTPQKYTFSVWIRGSKLGLKVKMRCFGFSGEKLKSLDVDDKWRRYSMTGIIPGSVSQHNSFDIYLETPGKIWIDGIQLEQGEEATEFEE